MAIYKLSEICTTIRGNSSFQKKDLKTKKDENDYVALHYGKTYKVQKVNKDYNFYTSVDFFKENQQVFKDDTVLVSTSETMEDLGHAYIYEREDVGLLGGEQILLKANEKIVLKKYLYYLTLGLKKQFQRYATGMKVYRFKKEDFKFIELEIPEIIEQQKIIDIIKPVEELFLKYSIAVRIDTFQNCEKDIKNLIDIIKPIEELFNQINATIELQKTIYSFTKTNHKIKDYVNNINCGYSYTKNEKSVSGIYNIYTIKNISGSTKYDKTDFSKNNILSVGDIITGMSGTIGTSTVISENDLVANQRTLSFKSDYPAQISFAIENQKNILVNQATGAVQKNIKKEDVLNLNFKPIYDKSFDELYIKSLVLRKNIFKIKNKILNLLVK